MEIYQFRMALVNQGSLAYFIVIDTEVISPKKKGEKKDFTESCPQI